MDNNPRYIHETVLKDIIGMISDYVEDPDTLLTKFGQERAVATDGMGYMRNIARSSRNLTLEFPVIVSDMVQVDNAVMVSKAIERKAVAMLQMLFSAVSITNARDAISYIKRFHTNLTSDGNIGVDDFVDFVDGMAANEAFHVDEKQFKAVLEDFKNCTNYYLVDHIKDKSLNEYSVSMDTMTVHDYPVKNESSCSKSCNDKKQNSKKKSKVKADDDVISDLDDEINFYESYLANNYDDDDDIIMEADNNHRSNNQQHQSTNRNVVSAVANDRKYDPKHNPGDLKDYYDYLQSKRAQSMNNQFSSDIKKANEMAPSMMVIQFTSVGSNGKTVPVDTTAVIGVKARLHYVTSKDMMDRIATKNEDKNGLFNFIKATTRQISFWKDFVFAIDKAKLNAIASSGRGTSSPIWRLLENRALRSKIRRWTGSINDAAAISTLVITRDEAEYLKKEYNLDLSRPGAVYPIMNAYNIMCFVIVDEPLERIDFLYDDGTNQYETLSFMHLEREDGGGQYKKIINLLAKSR